MSDTVQTRVAIAVRRMPAGAAVANDVAAREPIPSGHKVDVRAARAPVLAPIPQKLRGAAPITCRISAPLLPRQKPGNEE
jgi:hypothetical protein